MQLCLVSAGFSPSPRPSLGVNTSRVDSVMMCERHQTLPRTDFYLIASKSAALSKAKPTDFMVTQSVDWKSVNLVPRISSVYQSGSLLQLQHWRLKVRPQTIQNPAGPGPPPTLPSPPLAQRPLSARHGQIRKCPSGRSYVLLQIRRVRRVQVTLWLTSHPSW